VTYRSFSYSAWARFRTEMSGSASFQRPLPALLPQRYRRRPGAAQHSPARSHHFPCYPRGRLSLQTAWSVPVPCPDDPAYASVSEASESPMFSASGWPASHCCCSAIAGESAPRKARA
jgi:hypothetical protein